MKYLILCITLFLTACGTGPAPGTVVSPLSGGCQVLPATGGVNIQCNNTNQFISNGAIGATGATGAQGNAGTQISVVQFCPSKFIPTYPNTFPEIGLCLNNTTLIGVYSANDGFLAVLPPGSYESDGINASCAFTIGPNCEVLR